MHPVLINGQWISAKSSGAFTATNPQTGETLPGEYPISNWDDCDRALTAATAAYQEMLKIGREPVAKFLGLYADKIEGQKQELAAMANLETGLPVAPRLHDVELPRTIGQLRQASAAASSQSWTLPTIDTANNIRSLHASIGPVFSIGPNNFPFAYNGVAGGDFAAAIAAGNPVIAKAHPAHPSTSRMLAELAHAAAGEVGLPTGAVQMVYRTSHEDGLRMIADPRIMATGFTGSRHAGLAIKRASDEAGKPAYLEMSSVNPVVILPGAIAERSTDIVGEFCTSCLMAAGQFCTNPGFVVLIAGETTEAFVKAVAQKFSDSPSGTLLTSGVRAALGQSVKTLIDSGAVLVAGGSADQGPRVAFENTVLRVSGSKFLKSAETYQTEMFGAASLFVVAKDLEEVTQIMTHLEGNLTGTIYLAKDGSDDAAYTKVATKLRQKVGRLLNNKMPTGVAVSAAMNHGGPFPATGHAGFTAVGFPATIRRFSMLQSFDGVREDLLPDALRDQNPDGQLWRFIDGNWTQK